jgi:hypothetical protein
MKINLNTAVLKWISKQKSMKPMDGKRSWISCPGKISFASTFARVLYTIILQTKYSSLWLAPHSLCFSSDL